MTEVGWFACHDPEPMLQFLRGKVSERKLRLFACGCCRIRSVSRPSLFLRLIHSLPAGRT
jgi:hypothetical protein